MRQLLLGVRSHTISQLIMIMLTIAPAGSKFERNLPAPILDRKLEERMHIYQANDEISTTPHDTLILWKFGLEH